MAQQYNRHSNKIYPLSERGFRQAQRNNSHQIWSLLSWTETTSSQQSNHKQLGDTLATQLKQTFDTEINQTNIEDPKKSVSFKLSKNSDNDGDQEYSRADQVIEKPLNGTKQKQKSKPKSKPKTKPIESNNNQNSKNSPDIHQGESELQKLKRKSIEKYIKKQVPFTRTLSNSAFKKFYQRPCPEAYGRTNIKSGGVCYGDFMKTHNIQPHTLDNKPEVYQTFTSALNFGKRTKLDLQDRWKRIQRQLAKDLDYQELAKMKAQGEVQIDEANKQAILKENINLYGEKKGKKYPQKVGAEFSRTGKSLDKMTTKATLRLGDGQNRDQSIERRRAKSSQKPLYYIYKYKEEHESGYNCTRYARDRHGITCYVDPCFKENDEALLNFQKKIKPIYAQKCKPEDINIDAIRIKNNQDSKEQEYPRHYLTPCVEIPYIPNNYSRKKNHSVCETTA